ncbi:MAG TPA: nitronate monooxygenase [bacterium]|nr:nitronate monooxygenase [bacterium]
MKNELTRLLGIEHPVILGGMLQIGGARLAAAVSNAGGLGTIGQRPALQAWHDEIKKTKSLTDKPFAVNLPMHAAELDKRIEIILKEGVKIVVTAAGNPKPVMPALKDAGIVVMHVVASVDQAKKVEAAGVHAIVAEGGESGGMVARDRVSTIVLVPMVVDAVKVPVVAAGGIADARGLVAALALGAQGVQLGTRFIAADECEAPEVWKQGIIRARETDTMVVPRGKAQGRVLKEDAAPGQLMAGQIAGMITRTEPAASIIARIMAEAAPTLKRIEEQMRA